MTEDLLHRLEKVLAFAARAMPVLATLPDDPERKGRFRREKFICETALLLYAARGVRGHFQALDTQINTLCRALVPHARSEAMLTMMRLRPASASELAVAHACLQQMGFIDVDFQRKMASILASPMQRLSERLPWKEIEAKWFATLAGVAIDTQARSVLEQLTLSKGIDVLSARREELYAFTHALIYLSDFGRREPNLERSKADICLDVDCALARCLDDDDFDIAAELLMTWPYLRLHWSPTAKFAFSVLRRVEDDVGYLPSLSIRKSEFNALKANKQEEYFLFEAYHTVYVMGLLCASCLSNDMIDRDHLESDPSISCSTTMESLVPARTPMPQWEMDFARLAPADQAGLTPFLTTIALRRALHGNDFPRLRTILASVLSDDLPLTPSVDQAACVFGLLLE
jgi:hypothetical protein